LLGNWARQKDSQAAEGNDRNVGSHPDLLRLFLFLLRHRREARCIALRALIGDLASLDHVIDGFRNIGGMVAHALEVLGAKHQIARIAAQTAWAMGDAPQAGIARLAGAGQCRALVLSVSSPLSYRLPYLHHGVFDNRSRSSTPRSAASDRRCAISAGRKRGRPQPGSRRTSNSNSQSAWSNGSARGIGLISVNMPGWCNRQRTTAQYGQKLIR
jgi:hypothetical protein